jgi:multidrug efflux pump
VQVIPIMPRGLGQRGFSQPVQFVIGGSTYEELARWRDKVLAKARANKGFLFIDSDYKETKPQLLLEIDRNRAADLGVSLQSIGRTLETMLGSRKVTTYPDRGEEYNVILQGNKSDYRAPYDLTNIYVRSDRTNELIPISNLLQFKETATSAELKRFNRIRAVTISGALAPGYTLGEALDFLEKTAKEELPASAHIDYSGESLEYKQSGAGVYNAFLLSMLIVFLVLAAQFESFVHPLVIMTTVPLAVAGALFGLFMTLQTLNIFSQIGIIMLVGLAAKNGILIVEFANQLRDKGTPFDEALIGAAKLRLRPILMTSATAAMGSLPLLLTRGAGSESRTAIGVVVLFGVVCATALTLFIVPFVYSLMARRTGSPQDVAHKLAGLEKEHADVQYEEGE